MSDFGLPRTTMANFIKSRVPARFKISAEFTSIMLDISHEFIDRVAEQANAVCESEGKKTISNEHLYSSLKKLGMSQMLTRLSETDQAVKRKHKRKIEDKQRLQQTIDKLYKKQKEENKKDEVINIIFEHQSSLKPLKMNEASEEDFKQILDEESQPQK